MPRRLVLLLACLASLDASPAAAQDAADLRGRILEAGSGSPVQGATVTLQGIGTALTDAAGAFHFAGVPLGRREIVVHGLGYRPVTVELTLSADTALDITLDIAPVLLDSLGARDRRITLSGRVRDEETGRDIYDARVLVTPDHETSTNIAGRFRIRRLFAGIPIVAEVRALGYLPHPIALQPDEDTTLVFELRPDSVALRLIAAQEQRLEERSGRTPYFPTVVDRDDALRLYSWTAKDLVQDAVGRRAISCLFLDEREITMDMDTQLDMVLAPEVQRIEILRERPPPMMMVRVYTRRFFERTGLTAPLRPIRLIATFGRPHCT